MAEYEYRHFTNPFHRSEIKSAAVNIIEYAREHGIRTIVAAGPSAESPVRFIRALWKKLYPGEEQPKIHELGHALSEFEREKEEGHYDTREVKEKPRDWEEKITSSAKRELEEKHSDLLKRMHEPILLFDEYAETGGSINSVGEFFVKKLGAKNIHAAVLVANGGEFEVATGKKFGGFSCDFAGRDVGTNRVPGNVVYLNKGHDRGWSEKNKRMWFDFAKMLGEFKK